MQQKFMSVRTKMYYFTNAYPYGMSMLWKQYELETFRKYWDEITVIPFGYWSNTQPQNKVEGVHYMEPLFPDQQYISLRRKLLAIIFSPYVFLFIKELFSRPVLTSRHHFINWILDSYTALSLSRHPVIKNLLKSSDENTVWYFYWGRNASLVIPLLKKRKFFVCCRFHGYDLYAERNKGYITYQHAQVAYSDLLLPCSAHGASYLGAKYPGAAAKIYTARLGARYYRRIEAKDDGVLKLVSCATVRPVKRLHILAQALKFVRSKVSWVHVGGGGTHLEELKKIAAGIQRENISVFFKGSLPSRDIIPYYVEHNFDLFINVSESEGVPVSVMEAFSAGMPVFATDVGGTGEIVDDTVGKLLPKDLSPELLANCIDEFANLSAPVRNELCINSFQRFRDRCNADANARLLAEEIKKRMAV